ncbi:MAG: hypothetical protein ACRDG6_12285 [Candidatus Limnocylindria bacterium]
MRRVLTSVLLAAVLSSCSVEAPEYRPTATPAPTTAATSTPLLAVTYEVTPFDVRSGAAKTAIFFSNPNSFVVDWFMTVRLRKLGGDFLRDERIGNAGVPPNRADTKFQNWYFPIPPGDSWSIVRFEVAFSKSDVQEFKVARSLTAIGEVDGVRIAQQACAGDRAVGVIGCDLTLETTTTVPAFARLHLVVVVRGTASPRYVLSALQWRPELVPTTSPWLTLAAGETLNLRFHDSYPTPAVPWEYEVFVHVYRFSSV